MADRKSSRTWTAEQKLEIVKVRQHRADRREHEISSTLYYRWRGQLLEGGLKALAGKAERDGQKDLERKIARLERASASRLQAGGGGKTLAGLGVSVRVARSRELVAEEYRPAVAARVAHVSRQAIYRRPTPRLHPSSKVIADDSEQVIVDVARENPTAGYRMVSVRGRSARSCPPRRSRTMPERGIPKDHRSRRC